MLIGCVVGCVVDKEHGQSGFTKRYRYVLSSSVTKWRCNGFVEQRLLG